MYQLLTLDGAARFYDAAMDFALRARSILGLDWHVVSYERLMEDFDGQIRAICEYLGLEWTTDLEAFSPRVSTREHATPSTAQLARGLDRSGIGHWQHYRTALDPVLPLLEPWVQRLKA